MDRSILEYFLFCLILDNTLGKVHNWVNENQLQSHRKIQSESKYQSSDLEANELLLA